MCNSPTIVVAIKMQLAMPRSVVNPAKVPSSSHISTNNYHTANPSFHPKSQKRPTKEACFKCIVLRITGVVLQVFWKGKRVKKVRATVVTWTVAVVVATIMQRWMLPYKIRQRLRKIQILSVKLEGNVKQMDNQGITIIRRKKVIFWMNSLNSKNNSKRIRLNRKCTWMNSE